MSKSTSAWALRWPVARTCSRKSALCATTITFSTFRVIPGLASPPAYRGKISPKESTAAQIVTAWMSSIPHATIHGRDSLRLLAGQRRKTHASNRRLLERPELTRRTSCKHLNSINRFLNCSLSAASAYGGNADRRRSAGGGRYGLRRTAGRLYLRSVFIHAGEFHHDLPVYRTRHRAGRRSLELTVSGGEPQLAPGDSWFVKQAPKWSGKSSPHASSNTTWRTSKAANPRRQSPVPGGGDCIHAPSHRFNRRSSPPSGRYSLSRMPT